MGYTASFSINTTSFIESTAWALKGYDQKRDRDYILYEIDVDNSVLSASTVSNAYYFKKETAIDSFDYKESEEDNAREKQEDVVKFAADGRYLSKVIGVLPKGVELKIEEKVKGDHTSLLLKAPNQKLEVPLFSGKRPPKSPEINKIADVSARDLTNAFKALSKISDPSGASSIPAVSGLDTIVDVDNEKLTIMGTDMFTLSEITLGLSDLNTDEAVLQTITPEQGDKPRFLLHAQDASVLSKEAGNPDSTIELGVDDNEKIAFSFEDGRIACVSRIESETINYSNFKTMERDEKYAVLPTKPLLEGIKQANVISWDNDDIVLEIRENKFIIKNHENSSVYEVEFDGEFDNSEIEDPIETRFSYSVISKAFAPVSTEKVQVKWAGGDEFFRMKPVLESGATQDEVFIIFNPVLEDD